MCTPWKIKIDNSTPFISIISNSIPFNPLKGKLKEEAEGGDVIVIKQEQLPNQYSSESSKEGPVA